MILVQNRVRTCSSRNCKEKYSAKGLCKHHYDRKYKQRPEVKAMVKARELTPKYKTTRKKYRSSSEVKAKRKEPEVILKTQSWQRKYDSDPKNKLRKKKVRSLA